MRAAFNKISIFCNNILYFFLGLFCGRSKKNIVVGSWGGLRFADNSRFLYQYLFANKEQLGIKNVLWITRDSYLNSLLNSLGYTSILAGTKESKKWHLKSGIHIICNMAYDSKDFKSDIETKYSCGAKKIQLWHGVGVKSIGKASNISKQRKQSILKKVFHCKFFDTIFSTGCWFNEYFLCTSIENMVINYSTNYCKKNRMFISSYPRYCECLNVLEYEKNVIESLKKYNGYILHLPTFRSISEQYVHPLSNNVVRAFLSKYNYAFVEKQHTASKYAFEDENINNVVYLDSTFDINLLYKDAACVISDYSSAVFDGIHCQKPVILYTPDIDSFKNGDVGLLIDLESFFKGMLTKSFEGLIELLFRVKKGCFFTDEISNIYKVTNTIYFSDVQKKYKDIWNDILFAIDRKRRKLKK
jgi:CDP-glycerol glycerophosphotransferase (TagB/SpsB family)